MVVFICLFDRICLFIGLFVVAYFIVCLLFDCCEIVCPVLMYVLQVCVAGGDLEFKSKKILEEGEFFDTALSSFGALFFLQTILASIFDL